MADGTAGGMATGTEDVATLSVDTSIYTLEALFRACYQFTDRCYLFLSKTSEHSIVVEFRKRRPNTILADVRGAFANELIDQRIRADLAQETHTIRDWIVAQAFAEAGFDAPHE